MYYKKYIKYKTKYNDIKNMSGGGNGNLQINNLKNEIDVVKEEFQETKVDVTQFKNDRIYVSNGGLVILLFVDTKEKKIYIETFLPFDGLTGTQVLKKINNIGKILQYQAINNLQHEMEVVKEEFQEMDIDLGKEQNIISIIYKNNFVIELYIQKEEYISIEYMKPFDKLNGIEILKKIINIAEKLDVDISVPPSW